MTSAMQEKNSKEDQNKVIAFYDEYASRQKTVGINLRHQSIRKKLLNAGLKPNHKILEIGCGIGTLTQLLVHEVKEGSVVAIDIGNKNIEEAQRTLRKHKNLQLICVNAVEYDFKDMQFDVVVLPDVLEHIPIEQHLILFEKISNMLNPLGFVFIHIPNPAYLEWCHINRPDLVQIIDQPIYTSILIENTLPHGLIISKLETYSIWVKDGDYEYIVMRKKGFEDFTQNIEEKITLWDKVIYKLKEFGKK